MYAVATFVALLLLSAPQAATEVRAADLTARVSESACEPVRAEPPAESATSGSGPGQPEVAFHERFESWDWTGLPSGWSHGGTGWNVVRDNACAGEGELSAGLSAAAADRGAFGALTKFLPAQDLQGRRIRLTALVRTAAPAGGRTGLWLRVDRPGGLPGFFDNMDDRPISSSRWRRFTIEGDVAADAERIAFGLVQSGDGQAWIDDLRIEVLGQSARADASGYAVAAGPHDRPPTPLTTRGLRNLRALALALGRVRYFHPSDEAAGADWDRLAIAAVERVEPATSRGELELALETVLRPVAPSMTIGSASTLPSPPPGATAIAWRHLGVQTGYRSVYSSQRAAAPEGLSAPPLSVGDGMVLDVPITVWRDARGRTWPQAEASTPEPTRPEEAPSSAFDRTTRLANVVLAWSTLREFYPYFDVIDSDWDAALDEALRRAAVDPDPRSHAETLSGLLVALEDGHARVESPWLPRKRAPVALDMIEGQVVVVGVAEGAGSLRVGDVLTSVDGIPVDEKLALEEARVSGSPQWRRRLGLERILVNGEADAVQVTGGRADGSTFATSVESAPDRRPPLREPRPDPVSELAGDLLYVDLTRLDDDALTRARPRIESAAGVVFDLRGYPLARPWYLSRLGDRPARSADFDLPIFQKPGQAEVAWDSRPWIIAPESPRIPKAVFIADGSAISFAESILGVVAQGRLAPIVGSATAGANGNVNAMDLAGGYRIYWTGMRVKAPDGGVHHNRGISPTVRAERTLEGVRAGRDELLEAAVALLR